MSTAETTLPLTVKGYFVLVRERRSEKKSRGGIYLPSDTQDNEQYFNCIGEVVALGSLCYRDPSFMEEPWCKVGETVLFVKHSGQRVPIKENPDDPEDVVWYRILKHTDLYCGAPRPEAIRTTVY